MNKIKALAKKYRTETAVLILGVLYFLWYTKTGIGIPCVFHRITGFRCPGCGITHMVLHTVKLDFNAAYHDNPFLFVSLPFLAGEIIFDKYLRHKGKKMPLWNNVLLIVYLVMLLGFGVYRNIYNF
ncbi:Protein of unknown function [Lachnospiraceae bacterium]|nr:Protein of unknown function [Lachnospiraceae bacterium]